MSSPALFDNPDYVVGRGGRTGWNQSDRRRSAFHSLHLVARYGYSCRAPQVWRLTRDYAPAIAGRADVQSLTSAPAFSAMVVLRDDRVLYENYARDFGPTQPHSIMSISKTTMNLVIGRLVAQGKIDLQAKVAAYLPWIGPGYASATVQQVLNMDVVNGYTEDYADADAMVFHHEAATGFRLPAPGQTEPTTRPFIASVGLAKGARDISNPSGLCQYKSANTDVLAFIAEAVSGRPMLDFVIEIAEGAGVEGALHVALDRDGFPGMNGGLCLTARDLARYGMIFARGGRGVNDTLVGDPDFIAATRQGGIPMPNPRDWLRYSNQTNTDGDWLGHGGYGGQYMLVNPTTRTVCVFFSVLENESGYDSLYYPGIIRMFEEISRMA